MARQNAAAVPPPRPAKTAGGGSLQAQRECTLGTERAPLGQECRMQVAVKYACCVTTLAVETVGCRSTPCCSNTSPANAQTTAQQRSCPPMFSICMFSSALHVPLPLDLDSTCNSALTRSKKGSSTGGPGICARRWVGCLSGGECCSLIVLGSVASAGAFGSIMRRQAKRQS
jgi:hypothetical protein